MTRIRMRFLINSIIYSGICNSNYHSSALGQTLKKIGIMDRGETLIKVYMSEYLLGEYQYKLVVDGNPIKS